MNNDNNLNDIIDIKTLKYENYITKHPKRVNGYYCLGCINIRIGDYNTARNYLSTALELNNSHIPSILAFIRLDMIQKRYLSAASHYQKHHALLNENSDYITRVYSAVTSIYDENIHMSNMKLFSLFTLQKMKVFDKNKDNVVLKLIKAMSFIISKDRTTQSNLLYKEFVYEAGINDKLRWKFLQNLSINNPYILTDTDLASKFNSIPDGCTSEYCNIIFNCALSSDNRIKIQKIYKELESKSLIVSSSNLWKYVYWSTQINMLNSDVYNCCKRLIKTGWIDKVVASTMINIIRNAVVSPTEKELNILALYGYASYKH